MIHQKNVLTPKLQSIKDFSNIGLFSPLPNKNDTIITNYQISFTRGGIKMEYPTKIFHCVPFNCPTIKFYKKYEKYSKSISQQVLNVRIQLKKLLKQKQRDNILLCYRMQHQISSMHLGGIKFSIPCSTTVITKVYDDKAICTTFLLNRQISKQIQKRRKLHQQSIALIIMKNNFVRIQYGLFLITKTSRIAKITNKLVMEKIRVWKMKEKKEKQMEAKMIERQKHFDEVKNRKSVFTVHYKYWSQWYYERKVTGM